MKARLISKNLIKLKESDYTLAEKMARAEARRDLENCKTNIKNSEVVLKQFPEVTVDGKHDQYSSKNVFIMT